MGHSKPSDRKRRHSALECKSTSFGLRSLDVPSSERRKEIKRRRHRRKKVAQFAKKLEKATVSERVAMADKLRSLTPGSDVIIEAWELEKR